MSLFVSAMVVRFITRRYIGEYDPSLEKVYSFQTIIDNEMVYFDILDTAGQPEVIIYHTKAILILNYIKTCFYHSKTGFYCPIIF